MKRKSTAPQTSIVSKVDNVQFEETEDDLDSSSIRLSRKKGRNYNRASLDLTIKDRSRLSTFIPETGKKVKLPSLNKQGGAKVA